MSEKKMRRQEKKRYRKKMKQQLINLFIERYESKDQSLTIAQTKDLLKMNLGNATAQLSDLCAANIILRDKRATYSLNPIYYEYHKDKLVRQRQHKGFKKFFNPKICKHISKCGKLGKCPITGFIIDKPERRCGIMIATVTTKDGKGYEVIEIPICKYHEAIVSDEFTIEKSRRKFEEHQAELIGNGRFYGGSWKDAESKFFLPNLVAEDNPFWK